MTKLLSIIVVSVFAAGTLMAAGMSPHDIVSIDYGEDVLEHTFTSLDKKPDYGYGGDDIDSIGG